MTFETVLWIFGIAGSLVIIVNGLRPRTQPHSEPLGESWSYDKAKDALARYTEVLVENNALRELLKIDEKEIPTGSIAQVPESLLLPEYAKSTASCGVGSVIQIILMTRSYFGEPLPEDLADHLVLTSLVGASEATWSQTPTL